MKLFSELKRRKVFKVGAAYLVLAWLLIQVVDTLAPQLQLPGWFPRAITLTLMIGFPLAVVMAWMFDVTPDGLRREHEVLAGEPAIEVPAKVGRGANMLTVTDVASRDTSIAVLSFVDLSQGHDQDYFSEGLSEELRNQLTRIPHLRVIARTSSFAFKGKEVDVATVAKALNVANILEGSVRKFGSNLRITTQLVRAADSAHVWSHSYDREMADVFTVQSEIADAVVAALKVKLFPGQQTAHTQNTQHTESYEQYLLGMAALRHHGQEAVQRACAAFEAAVALDPQYANAYAGLATANNLRANYANNQPQRVTWITAASTAADRAVSLAPDLPDGYVIRGFLRYHRDWDWHGADSDFERALVLDPNKASTLISYAHALFFGRQRQQEAIAMARKATTIDPLSAEAWIGLAWLLVLDKQPGEARLALHRSLDINPESSLANFHMGYVDLSEGKAESALVHFRRATMQFCLIGTAMAEHTRGNAQTSQQALDELSAKYAVGFVFQIAEVHAWRGEKDQAFKWLERAYDARDSGMVRLRATPPLASLYDDPRFAVLVKKMNFQA